MTQGSTIALNALTMKLEKLLELLFVIFGALLQLILIVKGLRLSHYASEGSDCCNMLFELHAQPSPFFVETGL